MMDVSACTIGVGSNIASRKEIIIEAIKALSLEFIDFKVSEIYESEAFNGKDAPYLNAVFYGHTSKSCEQVEMMLKQLEIKFGRTPENKPKGEVALDLDLVIWDGRICREVDFERHYFNIGYRELLAKGAFEMA